MVDRSSAEFSKNISNKDDSQGNQKRTYGLEDLVDMLAKLRAPDGCPWDKEQTHETLRRYLIEEAYETIEAIDNKDFDHLKEELGDLLLQIVFHAQIASEKNLFTIEDVIESIVKKIERRHPHVFGDLEVSTADEVAINWEKIKSQEKKKKSILSGIPKSLPALLHAYKLQRKAARVGFDWDQIKGPIEKIKEEIDELAEAKAKQEGIEEEIGDLLFAIVNVARHLNVDPEQALKVTCLKFEKRFNYMEEKADKIGKFLGDLTLEEQDKLWDEAKNIGL